MTIHRVYFYCRHCGQRITRVVPIEGGLRRWMHTRRDTTHDHDPEPQDPNYPPTDDERQDDADSQD